MNGIPHGYRQDPQGRLVDESRIKPIDLLRDQLVTELVAEAKQTQAALRSFKDRAFNNVDAFVQLSIEQYRAPLGGKKGNVTLMSFDGRYKVVRQIQESIRFDERLQAAKALIDMCLVEWTEGARHELRAIINDAFRVDQQGNIRTTQVLGLRRLPIEDPRWLRAMAAIGDAVQIVGSKAYVRAYERDEQGRYQAIALDMASA
ncbi:DUF3164 family protein [Stenotrophomonas sp. 364]|uniref:DUF3164 family protein n=1 Tax=Stenotrophomonas sp. 364 TaxID=2691571 RepID=UPI001915F5E3|nr:DUF3164 family protein [Stenotrophomonas sp. 364]